MHVILIVKGTHVNLMYYFSCYLALQLVNYRIAGNFDGGKF